VDTHKVQLFFFLAAGFARALMWKPYTAVMHQEA